MSTMHRLPALFVLLLMAANWTSFFLIANSHTAHAAGASCIPRERDALLAFKRGISHDPEDYLGSWQQGSQDCCRWAGIHCSNTTGHVIQLNMSRTNLEGQISPSLLSLEHLEYLNLNWTYLTGPNKDRIPEFFGSFQNLTHLDLSNMNFTGKVPAQLGNLSKLEYLDLSSYWCGMHSTDISWLTGLPLLVYLDMSCTNLSSIAADWPLVVNMHPSLEHLSLSGCSLSSANQFLEHLNFTNLQHLDLSYNYFGHPIASAWFWNVTSIKYLDLSETYLYGPFPNSLGNMTSLQQLYFGCDQESIYSTTTTCNTATMTVDLRNLCDLEGLWLDRRLSYGNITTFLETLPKCSSNRFQQLSLNSNNMFGMIADGLGQLTSLTRLDLSDNSITGVIPLSIGNLSHLELLDLSYNNITGSIPKTIGNLSSLEHLDLSNNHLTRPISPELGNCTSLQYISLSNNNLIGQIPLGIESCTRLEYLTLSYNHLTGPIPLQMANCTKLWYLSLSNNLLTGHVPSKIGMLSNLTKLDLSNNYLDGMITKEHLLTLTKLSHLDLSHNYLGGPLPSEFGVQLGLYELIISYNKFTGHIPESICQLWRLLVLDLSNNFLEGELPQCSQESNLVFLLLSNNRFSGKFPLSLRNYSRLAFMDLSRNNLYGAVPQWIGELVNLHFLQLSHNLFHGEIPMSITNLRRLRQLSLAGNNMSGYIPCSLSNLTAMSQKHSHKPGVELSKWYTFAVGEFTEILSVFMKRQELKYGGGIFNVVSIDLSANHLIGGIPDGITSLNGLLNFNVSSNHLSGNIPVKIGAMKSIESLDLSRNNLSGKIPSSLSDLTYLSSLDLSYNNLEGRIPLGAQLDTLYTDNPSIYNGNIGLCGPPLARNCSGDNAPKHVNQEISQKVSRPELFFYFGLGSGFMAGLWVVFCALLFKKGWRVAYFRLFARLYDNAYVFVVVTWGRINGKAIS